MGKFSDTKYINTIDNLAAATKEKINNPYYIFSDKKPTKVTYYAQNIEKSTLDEASGLYGEHIGADSPFKFNKINDFLLYGIERINLSYEAGDYGVESNPITGECIVLPNTITPRPGDFFTINYVKETVLFKVNGVNTDTLDTGANIYSLEYSLDKIYGIERLESQVVKSFNFLVNNVGTDFNTIIQDCDVSLIKELEALIENLIVKFNNIFFNSKLQTFIINHDGWRMYDPFMIEFLIRNNVLKFGDEFIYVSHACSTNRTFGMDYMKTFFHCLENPDKDIKCSTVGTADLIDDPNSLFVTRLEDYYWIRHVDNTPYKTRIALFDMDVIDHIRNNIYYEMGNNKEYYNLWIGYFNDNEDVIKGDLISLINNMDYLDNLSCFYALGITIYILEVCIKKMISK